MVSEISSCLVFGEQWDRSKHKGCREWKARPDPSDTQSMRLNSLLKVGDADAPTCPSQLAFRFKPLGKATETTPLISHALIAQNSVTFMRPHATIVGRRLCAASAAGLARGICRLAQTRIHGHSVANATFVALTHVVIPINQRP